MTVKHSEQLSSNHVPYFKTYADEATRLADVSLVAGDIGKLVLQVDTNELYQVIATTPVFKIISNLTVAQNNQLIGALSTGLISGGEVSINVSGSTLDIAAGKGRFVDVTDPENPTVTEISWGAQSNVAIVHADGFSSIVYVTVSGTFGQLNSTSKQTNVLNNYDKILLARFQHIGTSLVTSVYNKVANPIHSPIQAVYDLATALGPIVISGNSLSAYGSALKMQKTEGYYYDCGSVYRDTPENPSVSLIPAESPVSMLNTYRNGLGGFTIAAPVTDLDVTKWDDASGTLATLGASEYANWRFYMTGTGQIFPAYPQNKYDSLNEAKQSILLETFEVPEEAGTAALIGYLTVSGSTTDLSDPLQAQFYMAISQAAIATTVISTQTAYNNSSESELVTNTTNEAFTVKQGADVGDAVNIYEAKDKDGDIVFSVAGNGTALINITNSKITSTTASPTSSATFATITSMSTTPAAGTYMVTYSGSVATTLDSTGEVALAVGGTAVTHTVRPVGVVASRGTADATQTVHTQDVLTFTGAETLTVVHRATAGTITSGNRSLILVKVGI